MNGWLRFCAIARIGLCLAVAAGLLLCGGACRSTKIPMTNISIPFPDIPIPKIPLPKIPLLSRGDADYRNKEWLSAFEETHARMAREYPFTEWKGVDWPALHDTFAPRIEAAAKSKDKGAYYQALREYIYSVPDGHMRIEDNNAARDAAIGAGYGFAVTELDNGEAMVCALKNDGVAAGAGMKWGARVVSWNGEPVKDAIGKVSTLWADMPPATAEGKRVQQARLLTRAASGTIAKVSFINPGADAPQEVSLTALNDGYDMLDATKWGDKIPSEYEAPFEFKTLAGGYGYVRIFAISPTIMMPFPAQVFSTFFGKFVKNHAPGVIVDVRGNSGGVDELAPKFVGFFFKEITFYQDVAVHNPEPDTFDIDGQYRLLVSPEEPQYDGPVVVLVDEYTNSAGEGIPMILSQLPNVRIVGMHPTHGSFGKTGGDIVMPCGVEGYALSYPVGRSLDVNGAIQVEGRKDGTGGVPLDVRIPMTEETVRAIVEEKRDVALEKAFEVLDDIGDYPDLTPAPEAAPPAAPATEAAPPAAPVAETPSS